MKSTICLAFAVLIITASSFAQTTDDAAELRRLLNEFLAGASKNDAEMHDRFWADDLIYTRSAGVRTNKQELMSGVRSAPKAKPGDTSPVYTAEEVRINLYGSAAVVAFRLVSTSIRGDKTEILKFLNTGTFVKRRGKWQAVAWQATAVPKESSR